MITTCTKCGKAWDEPSQEEADNPNRLCLECWREKDKYNTAVARRVVDKMLADSKTQALETTIKKIVERVTQDQCSQNALTELRAAAQDALEAIVEWRRAGFVVSTKPLEKRLRDAIAEIEGL